MRVGAVALVLVAVAAARASAQSTTCRLIPQLPTHTTTTTVGSQSTTFAGGGVLVRCPARGITLKGDSAEQYPDRWYMVGNVNYTEPRFALQSKFLTYYPADERIVASGDVHASLPNGSTLVGPQAEYLRAVPRLRAEAQMTAIGRPTITVIQKDSAGKPQPPLSVLADRVYMNGDSLMYGSGRVILQREDLSANGDSVFLDSGRETMRLMRNPQLIGTRKRPFQLRGSVIDAYSKNRKLQRVIARDSAVAVSQDLTLTADTIDLRVDDDLLQHAYAWGAKTRSTAKSPTQNLVADSIDVDMPKQRVRTVRAFNRAFAQGKADTIRFRAEPPDTTDWLRGDTIVAHFDTLPPRDTTKAPDIRQLEANGKASAMYHVAVSDTSVHKPAINYVRAKHIVIDFDSQKVALVTARDSVVGLYVEPVPDSTKARGTTTPTPGKPGAPTPAPKPPTSTVPLPRRKP